MPELRKDPIVGRWVILAPDRAKRPEDFSSEYRMGRAGFCPFCEGHEDTTPPEILAYRHPGTERNNRGWRTRVVPNKFPALQVEGNLDKRGDGIYDLMNGVGAHEVIIECPNHETNMSRLSVDNIREVLWVYRDRLVDLKRDPRLVHGLIFKNQGAPAGASLEHSHSQLIVTPVVPISVWEEMTGSLEFFNYRGRCIYCDMVQQELAAGSRVVLDTRSFLVLAARLPAASRSRPGSSPSSTRASTRTFPDRGLRTWAWCCGRCCENSSWPSTTPPTITSSTRPLSTRKSCRITIGTSRFSRG